MPEESHAPPPEVAEAAERQEVLDEAATEALVAADEERSPEEATVEAELEQGFRLVQHRGTTYRINRLTPAVRDKAAYAKARAFQTLIGQLKPLRVLRKELAEIGAWGPAEEAALEALRTERLRLEAEHAREAARPKPNTAKLRLLREKLTDLSRRQIELGLEKVEAESNSLESHAERAERYVKLAYSVERLDAEGVGHYLWRKDTPEASSEAVREETDEELFATINWNAESFWSGLRSDFLALWRAPANGPGAGGSPSSSASRSSPDAASSI